MIQTGGRLIVAMGVLVYGHAYAANIEAGKTKASDYCEDCHGSDGKGDADNPAIAGMAADKFTAAMKDYQAGVRTKSKKMAKAANKVNDEDIADLAAYYFSLK